MILCRPAAGVYPAGWSGRGAKYVDETDPFMHGLILAGHLVPLEPVKPPRKRAKRASR